jgi:hypothetical protein
VLPQLKSTERKLYTASNSTEAILEFNGTVQYESARTPVKKTMKNQIEAQLTSKERLMQKIQK